MKIFSAKIECLSSWNGCLISLYFIIWEGKFCKNGSFNLEYIIQQIRKGIASQGKFIPFKVGSRNATF